MKTDTTEGTQCLIHTTGHGIIQVPVTRTLTPIVSLVVLLVTINGGSSNPNSSLQGATNISRSDSVVTVPVFDFQPQPMIPALVAHVHTQLRLSDFSNWAFSRSHLMVWSERPD